VGLGKDIGLARFSGLIFIGGGEMKGLLGRMKKYWILT